LADNIISVGGGCPCAAVEHSPHAAVQQETVCWRDTGWQQGAPLPLGTGWVLGYTAMGFASTYVGLSQPSCLLFLGLGAS
jgi:hypothetical protein